MPPRNPWVCILIISILGLVAIGGTVGMVLLPIYGKPVAGELNVLVGGALGSLSSFLVQVPRGSVGAPTGHIDPATPKV